MPRFEPTPGRRFFVPWFNEHVAVYEGLLKSAGFEPIVLPPPGDEVREAGEAVASGKECHPYAMLAGDVARLVAASELRAGDVFFYPSTIIPCLLVQYRDGLRQVLRRLGADGVHLVTPNLIEWTTLVGAKRTVDLFRGTAAVDALVRAACRIRPYEKVPGTTDEVHRANVRAIGRAVERGSIGQAMAAARRALAAIPRTDAPRRPVVGVCGDNYTRVNDHANGDLFRRLEGAGCEVWPSPFSADVAEYNAFSRAREAWRQRRWRDALVPTVGARVLRHMRKDIYEALFSVDRERHEPDHDQARAMASAWLGAEPSPLVLLTVAKILDFVDGGASGVLSAACFNCMLGSITGALVEKMRDHLDDVPIATLVFGGSEGTMDEARLEAFVHQVKAHHARKGKVEAREGGLRPD